MIKVIGYFLTKARKINIAKIQKILPLEEQ